MRLAVILFTSGCFAGLLSAAPTRAPKLDALHESPPPITAAEAHHFADQLVESTRVIAAHYIKPVAQHLLVARGLVALHEVTGQGLPELLRVENALAGTDLHAEVRKVRRALGNRQAIRGDEAIRVSLRAIVGLLDPYSVYVAEEEPRRGQRTGIGLTLADGPVAGKLTVKGVALGGPALDKGVRPGDAVLDIDGESTANLSAAIANEKLVGPAGTPVALVIQPAVGASKTVTFPRELFREETVLGVQRLEPRHWEHLLDRERKIALIRLASLNEGTADELEAVLAHLKENGLRGLILDLRDCPGGLLDESTSVVQFLIPSGVVAKVKYRDDEETITVFRQNSYTAFPLAVLVGPETSGGGELIAAALQDHHRATLFGQRTRGKASIQRTPSLGLGGRHQVRLTVGYFHRPSGKNLHRHPDSKPTDPWGVEPDAEQDIRLTSALRQQIRDWRLLSDLRPVGAREALPHDDPEKDPVLLAARRFLETQVK
jgi:carboxyl-terminal processing protease